MSKYLLVYAGGSMPETDEQRDAVMKAWDGWFHTLGKGLVDGGNPISASKKVSADGVGYLNIGAQPWAEIEIDGRRWPYQTPQANIELTPGKHTITLKNHETRKTKVVQIKSGATQTLSVDMRN